MAASKLADSFIHLDTAIIDWRSILALETHAMQGVKAHYWKRTNDLILAIAESVNVELSGCFECDSPIGNYQATLLR